MSEMKHEQTVLVAEDGHRIHLQTWSPAGEPRGAIQLLHGLGEHILRYQRFATAAVGRGYVVYGHDHRGHGLSEGDRGYFADEDGWHFFVGRVDDMFTCAGENVYPGDVEQMLEQSPLVFQSSVVPVADELKGSLPVAFVVPSPGVSGNDETAAAIKQWSLENGPAYQHPRAVWFVDELQLAGTNKIDRASLTEDAERRWADDPARLARD